MASRKAAPAGFVEQAARGAVNYRRTQAVFLARGEFAWQTYQRTGQSRPAGEVFARIQSRIDARRQELVTERGVPGDDRR